MRSWTSPEVKAVDGRRHRYTESKRQVRGKCVYGAPHTTRVCKAYDSAKVRQQIKKALCRSSPAEITPPGKLIVPSAFIGNDTKSKITSAASKTGGASLPVTTNSPETSLQPLSSSAHSIGSSCESRP